MEDYISSSTIQIAGTIVIIAAIVFVLLIFIAVLLYFTTKWFPWRSIEDLSPSLPRGSFMRRRRRRRFLFVLDESSYSVPRGLDPTILNSIPILAFQSKDSEDGFECAVCLSELEEGEDTRLLPDCNHGFHVQCIDMWFQSHSTCPLCRTQVSSLLPQPIGASISDEHSLSISEESSNLPSEQESSSVDDSSESLTLPTNVLIWGDQTRVSSTSGNGVLRSDLEEATPSSAAINTLNEPDSGRSPIPTQFRSLTSMLSWEMMLAVPASSGTPRKSTVHY